MWWFSEILYVFYFYFQEDIWYEQWFVILFIYMLSQRILKECYITALAARKYVSFSDIFYLRKSTCHDGLRVVRCYISCQPPPIWHQKIQSWNFQHLIIASGGAGNTSRTAGQAGIVGWIMERCNYSWFISIVTAAWYIIEPTFGELRTGLSGCGPPLHVARSEANYS